MNNNCNMSTSNSAQTVEELLQMLTTKTQRSRRPPPVPPKPNLQLTDHGDYQTIKQQNAPPSQILERKIESHLHEADGPRPPKNSLVDSFSGPGRLAGATGIDSLDGRPDYINDRNTAIKNSHHNRRTQPFVTEFGDETNNNTNLPPSLPSSNTVEIFEVPDKCKAESPSNGNQAHTERLTQHSSAYYENNSIPVPLITSVSEDEDDVVVEQVFIESDDQPPRTSTPTSSRYISSTSSSGASTTTDTSRTHQCDKSQALHYPNSTSELADEDALNTSKETDESRNCNQSGCELIGVNDHSDQSANSKDSVDAHLRTPKANRVVNDFTMTSNGPFRSPISEISYDQERSANKVEDLEKLTSSMRNEIESLKNQITNLQTKVSQLESQVTRQKGSPKLSTDDYCDKSLASTITSERLSPFDNTSRTSLSKSTSTINRLALLGGSTSNHSMTYSRGRAAGANTTSTPNTTSLKFRSATKFPNPNQMQGAASGSKTLKNSRVHASTSSLCADNSRFGSVSPSTRVNSSLRQTYSSQKHEPMSHASLLSLSTIGHSTLRKDFATSGSITNLSQNENKMSCWTSMTNFLPTDRSAKQITYDAQERLIKMSLYEMTITIRLPNHVQEDYNIDNVVESPEVRLKLDWVHGYRGRDCRSNIHFLPTGECAYFVASIVVLYNLTEKTQRHYLGHTESVRCMAIHPNKLIIASGQSAIANRRDKRPIVRIWNAVSLATLRVIGFNEDFDCSICCLAFSRHDQGATLAVVDESADHTITLLDWQREKNWRVAEINSGHDPVLAIDFHPLDKDCLISVGRGTVNFWDIRGMTLTKKAGLFDKYDRPKYVLCLAFSDDGDTITGDSNGNIIIWPRGHNRPGRFIREAHDGGVFSILAMKDGRYLTGGRDRRIVEWDEEFEPTGREAELPEHCGGVRLINFARGPQVVIGTLRNSMLIGSLDSGFEVILQGHYEATSALAVHPRLPCYLTGGFDEQLNLFDARRHTSLHSKCVTMPVCGACFSPNGQLLVVGSIEGKWLLLDATTMDTIFAATDGSATVTCIKFSPNGRYFAIGSNDSHVYIYETNDAGNKFTRIGSCENSAPVKEIDWSNDSCYLQVQTVDILLSYWRAQDCALLDNEAILDDLKWSTHNCTIGFDVFGIWPEDDNAAFVSYCDRSNKGDLLATVNDVGSINVFKWPVCYNNCLSQKFYGNVERFDFIKFLPDDSKLIAVGAKCCVTTEWTVEKLK